MLSSVGTGWSNRPRLDRSARLSQMGIWWSPRTIGRGFRLKARRFRLVTTPHPRRAQTPSRSLPRSVHAERYRFRGALSTKASLLPPGAFGLVPPLHDDRPQISVPMTTTPVACLTSETPAGRSSFRSPASGCRALRDSISPAVRASDAVPPRSAALGRPLAPGTAVERFDLRSTTVRTSH
jgi:hypothetical protein